MKIIAEEIAKLYEHSDKIVSKTGETLVDINFITENEVDNILIERVKAFLKDFEKEYTEEEIISLANKIKKDAAKIINRNEVDIKNFEGNDIEK